MQTVLEANIGSVEISCPWCVHKYPFMTDLIVSEEKIPEMFYKLKSAYERILYLQVLDSKRISEITRLEQQLLMDRRSFAAKAAAKAPKCTGQLQDDDDDDYCPLSKGVRHCPG